MSPVGGKSLEPKKGKKEFNLQITGALAPELERGNFDAYCRRQKGDSEYDGLHVLLLLLLLL